MANVKHVGFAFSFHVHHTRQYDFAGFCKIQFFRGGGGGCWSGGAMVLGKLPVEQVPTALAVGAGGVVRTVFLSSISSLSFYFSLGDGLIKTVIPPERAVNP